MRRFQLVVFAALLTYIVLLAYWMLFGFGRASQSSYSYNLMPFITIKHYLTSTNKASALINVLGNIGVFIPFGLLLPSIGLRKGLKAYGVFLAGLIILELVQLVSRRGSLDVDDLLLNSLGFWIGYGGYHLITHKLVSNKGGRNWNDY